MWLSWCSQMACHHVVRHEHCTFRQFLCSSAR
jgi:hypothetical protein